MLWGWGAGWVGGWVGDTGVGEPKYNLNCACVCVCVYVLLIDRYLQYLSRYAMSNAMPMTWMDTRAAALGPIGHVYLRACVRAERTSALLCSSLLVSAQHYSIHNSTNGICRRCFTSCSRLDFPFASRPTQGGPGFPAVQLHWDDLPIHLGAAEVELSCEPGHRTVTGLHGIMIGVD